MSAKTKLKLKRLTLGKIRSWGPCYDPITHLPNVVPTNWSCTIVDILKAKQVLQKDRVWCALRMLNDKEKRLFAVWCARRALKTIKKPDPRSVEACDVAEKFANGLATTEELLTAKQAAYAAADAAAYAAADAAAYAAAAYAAADAYADAAAYAAAAADAASASAERAAQITYLTEHFTGVKPIA